ncbi:Armadillo beta-catenin repeat family protein [Seminavis robusta]|uniref:Armadillo beta-catenin repeat family protein n=1 Tax=Seminavis robusta TaxID=568900 RepID=A0A9N8DKU9_9STRA|nr:Armadillo beta-catenin repeat family protein [Seminavis robusta]|eukprot:Sro177_g077890.1 Armadillo beta-catenin repeat family protein (398) ;mRNA; f:81331-82524
MKLDKSWSTCSGNNNDSTDERSSSAYSVKAKIPFVIVPSVNGDKKEESKLLQQTIPDENVSSSCGIATEETTSVFAAVPSATTEAPLEPSMQTAVHRGMNSACNHDQGRAPPTLGSGSSSGRIQAAELRSNAMYYRLEFWICLVVAFVAGYTCRDFREDSGQVFREKMQANQPAPDLQKPALDSAKNLELHWREIAIVAFMKSEIGNIESQKLASRLLREKFCRTEADADLLINAGAAKALLDAMMFYQNDETIQLYGVSFIINASNHSKTNDGKLVALGAVDAVAKAMQLFPDNRRIQHDGCTAFNNLLRGSRDTCPALLSSGSIPLMVSAMERFPDNSDIQERCSRAFRALAESNADNINVLTKAGAIKAVESAATKHKDNEWVVKSRDFLVSKK